MITQELLRSLLHYDPETGLFRWLVSRPPRGKIGEIAGHDIGHGYWKISIGGKRYYAHRLAFLWMTGETPKVVDHINNCKSDNRWANLRNVTQHENGLNWSRKAGVHQRYGRWAARMTVNGETIHLGVFDTREEAQAARDKALNATPQAPPKDKMPPQPTERPKTTPRKFKWQGKTLSEWSRATGIPQPTIYWRIFHKGMHPREALNNSKAKV